jgi:hypothetical protein
MAISIHTSNEWYPLETEERLADWQKVVSEVEKTGTRHHRPYGSKRA